jgi:hypothetical protein
MGGECSPKSGSAMGHEGVIAGRGGVRWWCNVDHCDDIMFWGVFAVAFGRLSGFASSFIVSGGEDSSGAIGRFDRQAVLEDVVNGEFFGGVSYAC